MKKRFYSVFYMFVVTLCFSSLISMVKYINEDRIATNQKVKLQKIVLKIFGVKTGHKASGQMIDEIFGARIRVIDIKDKRIYICYAKDNRTIKGYAFPVDGPGFWGPIYGMAAVSPDASRMLGLAFYKHSETPGLGARISEEWFTNQFKGLNITHVYGDRKIFYLNQTGIFKDKNELDAITGATQTSRCVELFLNNDLERFLDFFQKVIKGKYGKDADNT